jgi:hypothetical protein
MQQPRRLVVPTCIGCGAMAVLGTCETGCREQRLDLVRAAACDELIALGSRAHARAHALAAVAEELAACKPAPGEWQAAYEALQRTARAALQRHAGPGDADLILEEESAPATTWWCSQCGGIDAPQPCLGVCLWRPVEWVRQDVYKRQRARALDERDRERRLRGLLRRLALVVPRQGRWQENFEALQADAREALANSTA